MRKQLDSKLEEIKQHLEKERIRIIGQLESRINADVNEKGDALGKKDEASLERSKIERELNAEKHLKTQLEAVENAIEKCRQGTYGFCEICGKAIPLDRLDAIPHTSLCIECKRKGELGY